MTASTLDKRLEKGIETLQRMRDHLKLEVHLARMDAKERWEALEPDLYRATKLGDEVAKISLKALDDVRYAVKEYRLALKARHDRAHAAFAPKDRRRASATPPSLR